MTDFVQRGAQTLAYTDDLTRNVAIFFAGKLVFVLVIAWLLVVLRQRSRITPASVIRLVLLLGVSYIGAKLVSHVVSDPRPYLVQHIQPLIPLSTDNGFPSDHSLLAWALAISLVWFAPSAVWPFVVGAILVMLGRLGVAAHHTVDVTGSALIVIVVALIVSRLPLPDQWEQRLFADRRWPAFLRVP
jgi:membrane-associated phospholipid phosphatase